jgi:hypothetical protein
MVNIKQYLVSDNLNKDVMGTATIYDIRDLLRANFVLTEKMSDESTVGDVIDELVDALSSGGYTEDLEEALGITIKMS